jgi:hypothetical protein
LRLAAAPRDFQAELGSRESVWVWGTSSALGDRRAERIETTQPLAGTKG